MIDTIVRAGRVSRGVYHCVMLGLLITGRESAAQHLTNPARLSVRPHEMATGARNAQAGERVLPSLDSAIIYVPPQCVGTHRVPLVVVVHGGGGSARNIINAQRQFADTYGMIILAPNSPGGHWLNFPAAVAPIDSALKIVLREYAIDPDKIAITGMSEGGAMTLFLGRNNLDVFSRVAPESPIGYREGGGPQNTTTQFFVVAGIGEGQQIWNASFDAARQEQQAGRPVDMAVILRRHERRVEDEALIWTWLSKSWATPKIAVITAPLIDTTLVLTTAMFDQLNDFWNRFMDEPLAVRDAGHKHAVFIDIPADEARQFGLPTRMQQAIVPWPDSVSTAGRRANQTWVSMMVGQERVVVPTMNLAALAEKNASVAADLREAGLTARQAETIRIVLLSALATMKTPDDKAGAVVPGSVLAKNMAFVHAHPDEMAALDQVGMWEIP